MKSQIGKVILKSTRTGAPLGKGTERVVGRAGEIGAKARESLGALRQSTKGFTEAAQKMIDSGALTGRVFKEVPWMLGAGACWEFGRQLWTVRDQNTLLEDGKPVPTMADCCISLVDLFDDPKRSVKFIEDLRDLGCRDLEVEESDWWRTMSSGDQYTMDAEAAVLAIAYQTRRVQVASDFLFSAEGSVACYYNDFVLACYNPITGLITEQTQTPWTAVMDSLTQAVTPLCDGTLFADTGRQLLDFDAFLKMVEYSFRLKEQGRALTREDFEQKRGGAPIPTSSYDPIYDDTDSGPSSPSIGGLDEFQDIF